MTEEKRETPPFTTTWHELYGRGEWVIRYPTGHEAHIERTYEEYWAPVGDGAMQKRRMNGYRGTVRDPDGNILLERDLGNNRPMAMAVMADRGYRHTYGIVEYALATKGREVGRKAPNTTHAATTA